MKIESNVRVIRIQYLQSIINNNIITLIEKTLALSQLNSITRIVLIILQTLPISLSPQLLFPPLSPMNCTSTHGKTLLFVSFLSIYSAISSTPVTEITFWSSHFSFLIRHNCIMITIEQDTIKIKNYQHQIPRRLWL